MFYQPDNTWSVYRIKNQDDFVKRFVIKGLFHKAVHEDVLKSYETVEYLMAHAYYHWPMYDEAYKKLLSIFEMAVKLRCKELDIELEFVTRSGKKKNKILANLINDLISYGYPDELKLSLDWVRELRNMWAHPERHSFGGGFAKGPIIPIINIINSIFRPPIDVANRKIRLEQHQQEMEPLLNKVFVLNHNGNNILVYDPKPIRAIKIDDNWVYAWHIHPVLAKTKELLEVNKIPPPLVFFLKDEEIHDSNCSALNFETGSNFELSITTKPENIVSYQKHIDEFESLEEMNKFAYKRTHDSTVIDKVNNFIYNNALN